MWYSLFLLCTPVLFQKHNRYFHNRVRCPQCGEELSKIRLKLHIRIVHNRERNFQCDLCSYTSFSKSQMNQHMKKHFRYRVSQLFYCNLCPEKKFTSESSLVSHNRIIHQKKLRICEQCGEPVKNYIAHMATHNGIKPYKCPECDEHFYCAS